MDFDPEKLKRMLFGRYASMQGKPETRAYSDIVSIVRTLLVNGGMWIKRWFRAKMVV